MHESQNYTEKLYTLTFMHLQVNGENLLYGDRNQYEDAHLWEENTQHVNEKGGMGKFLELS